MEKRPDIYETLSRQNVAGLRGCIPNLTDPKAIREIHAELKRLTAELEAKLKEKVVKSRV